MPKPSKQQKKKVAKKAGSNIFNQFTQAQLTEFKEGFCVMDKDKDGLISKEDLRATFAEIGRPGMFASRSAGGEHDDDETVVSAIQSFETEPGMIDSAQLRSMLMSFGDKFTDKEVDDVLEISDMDPDTGMIKTNSLIGLLVTK